MKNQFKIHMLLMVLVLAISACSTVKKLPATVAGASRARFVGTWTLSKVNYDGLIPGSVQAIFDQATPASFVGSTWNLTNSGNGVYSLTNATSQAIFWSYNNSNGDTFQFKKLYQGDSARKVQEGYQLQVTSIDNATMVLRLPVALGDRTAYVVLSFDKAQ